MSRNLTYIIASSKLPRKWTETVLTLTKFCSSMKRRTHSPMSVAVLSCSLKNCILNAKNWHFSTEAILDQSHLMGDGIYTRLLRRIQGISVQNVKLINKNSGGGCERTSESRRTPSGGRRQTTRTVQMTARILCRWAVKETNSRSDSRRSSSELGSFRRGRGFEWERGQSSRVSSSTCWKPVFRRRRPSRSSPTGAWWVASRLTWSTSSSASEQRPEHWQQHRHCDRLRRTKWDTRAGIYSNSAVKLRLKPQQRKFATRTPKQLLTHRKVKNQFYSRKDCENFSYLRKSLSYTCSLVHLMSFSQNQCRSIEIYAMGSFMGFNFYEINVTNCNIQNF